MGVLQAVLLISALSAERSWHVQLKPGTDIQHILSGTSLRSTHIFADNYVIHEAKQFFGAKHRSKRDIDHSHPTLQSFKNNTQIQGGIFRN